MLREVLVVTLVLALSHQTNGAICFGLSCSSCVATAGCGFCQTALSGSCVNIPVGTPADKCPGVLPGTYSPVSTRIPTVGSCPNLNPCSSNPCTTAPLTKCVPNLLANPSYTCIDPCLGVLCDFGKRCSSSTGSAVCVDACDPACGAGEFCLGNPLTGHHACYGQPCLPCSGGQICDLTDITGLIYGCVCPVGQVLLGNLTSGLTCQPPPLLDLCNPSPCPFAGQVCSLSSLLGSAVAAVCNCPLGTTLGVTGSTTLNPDGTQIAVKACLADPCIGISCGGNQTCITGSNAVGAIVSLITQCICKSGFIPNPANSHDCIPLLTPCPSGQVRDLLSGLCVNLCPDNFTIPINNVCPTICPLGQIPNPLSPTSCGVLCPDRSWAPNLLRCPCLDIPPLPLPGIGNISFRLCCNASAYEVPDVLSGFPGSLLAPKNQGCVKCPCALTNTCKSLPLLGVCPDSLELCAPGWTRDSVTGKCRFNCNTTALLSPVMADFPDLCPVLCPLTQVLDGSTRQCVSPCPDGSIPFGGHCQVICPEGISQFACCLLKGGSNCQLPCPFGTGPLTGLDALNNLTCIELCPSGFPKDPLTNKCNEDDIEPCPWGSTRDANDVCQYPCPPTLLNLTRFQIPNPLGCCIWPAIFDQANLVCRCPDGRRTRDDGTCEMSCDPFTDLDCPCPLPLFYDYDQNVCACPLGNLLQEGGCKVPQIECLTGLVPSNAGGSCLCPDGQSPLGDLCPCDPSKSADCPVTPFNCKFFGLEKLLPACICLGNVLTINQDNSITVRDPMCLPSGQNALISFTLSLDFCNLNPQLLDCFCILHPNAESCKRPHPCYDLNYAKQNVDECSPDLCIPGDTTSFCPLKKFCSLVENLNLTRCDCIRDPSLCSFLKPPVLPSSCSLLDREDPLNIGCLCKFNLSALCFNSDGKPTGDQGLPNIGTILSVLNSTGFCQTFNCTKEPAKAQDNRDILGDLTSVLFNLTDVVRRVNVTEILADLNKVDVRQVADAVNLTKILNQLANLPEVLPDVNLTQLLSNVNPDTVKDIIDGVSTNLLNLTDVTKVLDALNITDVLGRVPPVDVQDLVNIVVSGCGNFAITRTAQAVSSAQDQTAPVMDGLNRLYSGAFANVSSLFRMVLSQLTEFSDLNGDGILNAGDAIRSRVNVSDLVCSLTRTPAPVNGGACDTVTMFDNTNILSLTYTICNPQLIVGNRIVPPRSIFQVLEVHYKFSYPDSKLAFSYDLFSNDVADVFAYNVELGELSLTGLNGFSKGFLSLNTIARVGDVEIPIKYDLTDTSTWLVIGRQPGETKSSRLVVGFDTFAPETLVTDHTASSSQEPIGSSVSQFSAEGSGQGAQTGGDDDSSSLSDGAVAGIVVGSVAGAAILGGIAYTVMKPKPAYGAPGTTAPTAATT